MKRRETHVMYGGIQLSSVSTFLMPRFSLGWWDRAASSTVALEWSFRGTATRSSGVAKLRQPGAPMGCTTDSGSISEFSAALSIPLSPIADPKHPQNVSFCCSDSERGSASRMAFGAFKLSFLGISETASAFSLALSPCGMPSSRGFLSLE